MPAPQSSRDDAVSNLFAVFRDHGYDGASLSALAQGTGLGRSSLYHHFPGGKEEMASAVLDRAAAFLAAAFADAAGTPPARLDAALDAFARLYAEGKNACVLGAFTHGEARMLFQRRLRDLFGTWIEGFAAIAEAAGLPAREARERAEDAVACLQGALVVAAGRADTACFRRAIARVRRDLLGAGGGRP